MPAIGCIYATHAKRPKNVNEIVIATNHWWISPGMNTKSRCCKVSSGASRQHWWVVARKECRTAIHSPRINCTSLVSSVCQSTVPVTELFLLCLLLGGWGHITKLFISKLTHPKVHIINTFVLHVPASTNIKTQTGTEATFPYNSIYTTCGATKKNKNSSVRYVY